MPFVDSLETQNYCMPQFTDRCSMEKMSALFELFSHMKFCTFPSFSWRCDCRLRSFRLWLADSNVPREVEASCHGPARLMGIPIASLALTEFACEPELSPTSMYLTVPRGKNVSIVCTVSSDPVSDITWFFNGRPISQDQETDKVINPK